MKNSKLVISNKDVNEILDCVSESKGIPHDIQKHIYAHVPKNRIDSKLKKEITEFVPRLKKIHFEKRYNYQMRHESLRLLSILPHKYKKSYLIALDNDITIPKKEVFQFLIKYWKSIVCYIGNRDTDFPKAVYDFILDIYAKNGIDPPSQVKFRNIVNYVDQYYYQIIDPLDYDENPLLD
tara:strand:+ start:20129 stop:20668 length:540 start_codon:yes stop_codon:yes gene_type:complete